MDIVSTYFLQKQNSKKLYFKVLPYDNKDLACKDIKKYSKSNYESFKSNDEKKIP